MAKEKEKCCKPGLGILGTLFMVFGVYFLIWGIMLQTRGGISWSTWNWSALLLYLIALVLLGFGKMMKFMGHGCCGMHHK